MQSSTDVSYMAIDSINGSHIKNLKTLDTVFFIVGTLLTFCAIVLNIYAAVKNGELANNEFNSRYDFRKENGEIQIEDKQDSNKTYTCKTLDNIETITDLTDYLKCFRVHLDNAMVERISNSVYGQAGVILFALGFFMNGIIRTGYIIYYRGSIL